MAAAIAEASPEEKAALRVGRAVRSNVLRQLEGVFSGAEGVVVVRLERVPTRDLNGLRNSLKGLQADFKVAKNNLCRRLFKEQGWTSVESLLEGTSGISLLRGDPSMICKLLSSFAKDHEGFVLKGGVLNGQVLEAKDVTVIGRLPGREVLLSQLAGVAQSPLRNLLFVLQGPIRSLALALGAVGQRKEKEETV